MTAGLDASQQAAVDWPVGSPLVVHAGPGSGKTRTLVGRVVRLVESGVDRESILVVTFARKARGEVLERLREALGPEDLGVSVKTFHGLGIGIRGLDARGEKVAFLPMGDAGDDEGGDAPTVAALIATYERLLGWSPGDPPSRRPKMRRIRDLALRISLMQEMDAAAGRAPWPSVRFTPEEAEARAGLEEWLRTARVVDGSRMLLEGFAASGGDLSSRYAHVLVDEAQDMSPVQWLWARSAGAGLFAVGDRNQCIYDWRLAEPGSLAALARAVGAESVSLSRNYRSRQEIVKWANGLLPPADRNEQECVRGAGGQVMHWEPAQLRSEEDTFVLARKGEDWKEYGEALDARGVVWGSLRGDRGRKSVWLRVRGRWFIDQMEALNSGANVPRRNTRAAFSTPIFRARGADGRAAWARLFVLRGDFPAQVRFLLGKGSPTNKWVIDLLQEREIVALPTVPAQVRLLLGTIHAAKGLEASRVVVLGDEDVSGDDRRVYYVAATRAKDTLHWVGGPSYKPGPLLGDREGWGECEVCGEEAEPTAGNEGLAFCPAHDVSDLSDWW